MSIVSELGVGWGHSSSMQQGGIMGGFVKRAFCNLSLSSGLNLMASKLLVIVTLGQLSWRRAMQSGRPNALPYCSFHTREVFVVSL